MLVDTRPCGRADRVSDRRRRCGAAAQDHRTSGRRDSTIKCGAPGDPPEQPDNPDRRRPGFTQIESRRLSECTLGRDGPGHAPAATRSPAVSTARSTCARARRCARSSRTAARHLTGWRPRATGYGPDTSGCGGRLADQRTSTTRPQDEGDSRVWRPAAAARMGAAERTPPPGSPSAARPAQPGADSRAGALRRLPPAHLPPTRHPPADVRQPDGDSSAPAAPPVRPARGLPRPATPRRTRSSPTLGAAHKPGAIPLRPLVLGDIFDGAFRIIRYNPQATVGAAVLVSAVAMVLPVVTALVSGSTGDPAPRPRQPGRHRRPGGQPGRRRSGRCSLGLELQSVGLLFVSGDDRPRHLGRGGRPQAHASARPGRATHGKRWRLFGMAVLLGLAVLLAFALVAGVLLIGDRRRSTRRSAATVVVGARARCSCCSIGYVLFWVRVRATSPVPTLMLEPVGVFGALGSRRPPHPPAVLATLRHPAAGRARGRLRRQHPAACRSASSATCSSPARRRRLRRSRVLRPAHRGAGTVLSSAFVHAVPGRGHALLYVDQRIRKEAYDVELLQPGRDHGVVTPLLRLPPTAGPAAGPLR